MKVSTPTLTKRRGLSLSASRRRGATGRWAEFKDLYGNLWDLLQHNPDARSIVGVIECGAWKSVVPKGQRRLAGGGVRNERNHRNTQTNGMRPGGCAGMSRHALRRTLRGASIVAGAVRWFPLADSLHHRLSSIVPPGRIASIAFAPHLITLRLVRAQTGVCGTKRKKPKKSFDPHVTSFPTVRTAAGIMMMPAEKQ